MISFAIVNWNGGEVFKECIESIHKSMKFHSDKMEYEIIVVDNASKDLDLEWIGKQNHLKLIQNNQNDFFSKATNQSLSHCKGEFVFILNNDVMLKESAIQVLLGSAGNKKNDLIALHLYYPNGLSQKSLSKLPTLVDIIYAGTGLSVVFPFLNQWLNPSFDYEKSQETQLQPMFSAIFMPRRTWDTVGDLDEMLPLLWNDTDWFKRFYRLGLRCFYESNAQAVHVHGMSTKKLGLKKISETIRSMRIYFYKNHNFNFFEKLIFITFSQSLKYLGYTLEIYRYLRS